MAQIEKVRWTPLALADLNHAYDYIARERPSAAEGIIRQVERALDAMILYPLIGRDGRLGGTRELYVVHTPFIIAYRTQEDQIEILVFMHTSRRWPASLK